VLEHFYLHASAFSFLPSSQLTLLLCGKRQLFCLYVTRYYLEKIQGDFVYIWYVQSLAHCLVATPIFLFGTRDVFFRQSLSFLTLNLDKGTEASHPIYRFEEVFGGPFVVHLHFLRVTNIHIRHG